MNAPRIVLTVGLLAHAVAADLIAQQDMRVAPGARVRVTAPTVAEGIVVGTVASAHSDTLVLEVNEDSLLAIPLTTVTSLEVSEGQSSSAGSGAVVGGLAGLVAGALIASSIVEESSGSGFAAGDYDGIVATVGGAVAGLFVGAIVGAGIGSAIMTENWKDVPVDEIRVGLLPAFDGVAVSASIRF